MKKTAWFFLALLTTASAFATSPTLEKVRIGKLYAPRGFDSNDKIQVQIAGMLENTCHYLGPTEVYKSGNHVEITQYAYQYDGTKTFCLQMQIPYTTTVNLGLLEKPDTYDFVDGASKAVFGTLPVTQAPEPISNPDSDPYAPIEDASIDKNPTTGLWEVRLKVAFSNRCTKLKSVTVDKQDDRDTVLVKPVAENFGVAPSAACPAEENRFVSVQTLPKDIKGVWLLHVRAAGGMSINKLTVLQ